ncbi:hypothetical protein D3C80_1481560 [compost metagenome]
MTVPVNQPALKGLGHTAGSELEPLQYKIQFIQINKLTVRRVQQTLPGITGQILQTGIQRLNAALQIHRNNCGGIVFEQRLVAVLTFHHFKFILLTL